jgi:hypothetical protein
MQGADKHNGENKRLSACQIAGEHLGKTENGCLSPNWVPDGVVRDKQLQVVNIAATLFKWNNGMAVNLKELAVVTGYDYAAVRHWGVPLFNRKITKLEFNQWKREQRKKEVSDREQPIAPRADLSPGPATAARQRRLAADKLGGSPHWRGSSTSSRSQRGSAGTVVASSDKSRTRALKRDVEHSKVIEETLPKRPFLVADRNSDCVT